MGLICEKSEIRCEIFCQKDKQYTARLTMGENGHAEEAFSVRVVAQDEPDCQAARFRLTLHNNSFTENWNLRMETPVRLWLPVTPPQKMTVFYLFKPWWTRPAFVESFRDIPRKTQVALLQYPDRVGCLLPMVGEQWKAELAPGTDTEMVLELHCGVGGICAIDEPLYLHAEAPTADQAIHRVFARLAREKGVTLRQERRVPEPFHYLGWCSWDAFYREVNETGVRQKAEELFAKGVPVRWMLVDDGWLDARYDTDQLLNFTPDVKKFPHGFEPLIQDLREQYGVRWVGVWHALPGYWGGVAPDSPAQAIAGQDLIPTAGGKLLPNPGKATEFYRRWYRMLRSQGVGFVKVDVQSLVADSYENVCPLAQAAAGLVRDLEAGASVLDGAVLNCMGMAMELMAARPATALSRNSDDFFPREEGSFVEHLMQNAYNSLYHNELYVCDWDMFWTSHPAAGKHALLRAISGGPVYVSDQVGETDPEVLRPLACSDGRLLQMGRSAKPTDDCIFQDPRKSGVLKLHNAGRYGEQQMAGGIAVYNLAEEERPFSFTAADIPELDAEASFWVYDFLGHRATRLTPDARYQGRMTAGGYGWYLVLPGGFHAALLGLAEKYVGFAALESVRETDDATLFVVRESGTLGWLTERRPRCVAVNGVDCTDRLQVEGPVQTLSLPESEEKAIVALYWDQI